jgi:hypothetical protein
MKHIIALLSPAILALLVTVSATPLPAPVGDHAPADTTERATHMLIIRNGDTTVIVGQPFDEEAVRRRMEHVERRMGERLSRLGQSQEEIERRMERLRDVERLLESRRLDLDTLRNRHEVFAMYSFRAMGDSLSDMSRMLRRMLPDTLDSVRWFARAEDGKHIHLPWMHADSVSAFSRRFREGEWRRPFVEGFPFKTVPADSVRKWLREFDRDLPDSVRVLRFRRGEGGHVFIPGDEGGEIIIRRPRRAVRQSRS